MRINPNIFKAYDIRGKFPKELDIEGAKKIGNAVAAFLARKYKKRVLTLIVGADVRTSSPVLKKALIDGITLQGSSVIDIGTVTTPLFYFLLQEYGPDGGVMVTASHNPPEYNGFKIRGRNTEAIAEDSGLRSIQKLAGKKELVRGKGLGNISEEKGGAEQYVAYLLKKVKLGASRVVVDAAGGSTTLVLPKLLSYFPGIQYRPLFFEPDGSFSRHSPNPLEPESQEYIKEDLKNGSFDFGVIFDGDGDRAVFFDEFGNYVRGDLITALLAEKLLEKRPGSRVVLEFTASKTVEEYITERGGKVERAKVGFANITRAMKKKKALLGGEGSGHFYFKDFGYNESSMYAFLKMLEIVSGTPKKLSHLVAPLNKYPYISGQQLFFEVENRVKVMRVLEKRYGKEGKVSKLDGISVEFRDWWFNARPSNTEPLVRLTLEAKTQELFDEKKKELSDFIRSSSN